MIVASSCQRLARAKGERNRRGLGNSSCWWCHGTPKLILVIRMNLSLFLAFFSYLFFITIASSLQSANQLLEAGDSETLLYDDTMSVYTHEYFKLKER